MTTFGKELQPTLTRIEQTILWRMAEHPTEQPKYPKQALVAASQIFMDVLMDQMFNFMMANDLGVDVNEEMALKAGKEFSTFILKYTGQESKEFYK
jgi:hypothetical protein